MTDDVLRLSSDRVVRRPRQDGAGNDTLELSQYGNVWRRMAVVASFR